ncbi:MAG: response regulator [Acidobacteriota bacterium]
MMIVQCPNCFKRYRLAQTQSKLLRVRCKGCSNEFLVAPTQRSAHEVAGGSDGAKVVVADIQRDFRNLLVGMLQHLGLHLYVVEDGAEALQVVHKTAPVLLLVNPYLPKVMGTDLIERLRKDKKAPKSIILLGAIHNHRRYRNCPVARETARSQRFRGAGRSAGEAGRLEDRAPLRLARIIFTDLLVYEPERMGSVEKVSDFFTVFKAEAEEGRRYLEQKFPGKGSLLRQVVSEYLHQDKRTSP